MIIIIINDVVINIIISIIIIILSLSWYLVSRYRYESGLGQRGPGDFPGNMHHPIVVTAVKSLEFYTVQSR